MNPKLVTRVATQKLWLQEAARRILEKGSFDSTDLTEVTSMVVGTLPIPPQSPIGPSRPTAGTILKLVSLGPVDGIDRLKPKNPLSLGGKPISIIYGANGTGKSGYVRILKNVSGKPRTAKLRTDVFSATPSQSKCTINFSINGSARNHEWTQDSGPISDLGGVDIYDTTAGAFYLDQDLEVNYAPPEVALLSKLVEACKLVEARLASERDSVARALPLLPPEYEGTTVARLYLDVRTNATRLSAWTPALDEELHSLRARLAEPDPLAKVREIEETKNQATKVAERLKVALGKVSEESMAQFRLQIAKTQIDVAASMDSAHVFGDITKLDGVASSSWKALWESARKYSELAAYQGIAFPNTGEGARCVLCHQPLDSEASKRLSTFETFVKGELSATAEASQQALTVMLESFEGAPEADELRTLMVAAKIKPELQDRITSLWAWLGGLMRAARELPTRPSSLDGHPLPPVEPSVIQKILAEHISSLGDQIGSLTAQLVPGERLAMTTRVKELRAMEWASQQASTIAVEVARLNREAGYNAWIAETGTTGISRKAGELADELITQAFVDRFNGELAKLGASRLRVEFKKTSASGGRPKYRLVLKGVVQSSKPGEILSEGENRIVSLAAFLADVTGKAENTPFVFDDPISSLDQTFEEKTAARLVELSQTRQLIVFTHRLSLASLIQNAPDADSEMVALTSEHWGTGNPGLIPLFGNKPEKALNDLINGRLSKARKVYEETGSQEYSPQGKALCSDFRILLERFVEQVLLNEVVLRYRRSVTTLNKLAKLCRIKKQDCDLFDALMTKYSVYEHSQPSETPVEPLLPEELAADFETVRAWFTEFNSRSIPA